MNERSPKENFDPNRVLNSLFSGRITPSQASRQFKAGFESLGLGSEEVMERLASQHQFFQEGNLDFTNKQKVAWDDVVICLENTYKVPQELKISNNRLVPPGSPVGNIPFEEMPF